MPKRSKFPKLRSHKWTTAGGEVRAAYYYDMRSTGTPDASLGSDYKEALRQWHEIHFDRPRIAGTIEEAFKRWEAESLPAYESATTRRNYAQSLRTIRPVFGPAAWAEVKTSTIAAYLKKRTAKTQANREKALLSVIWGKAREWDMTELPFPAYRMRLKNPEHAQNVEVTQAAFDAVYRHAPQHLRDAMDIASSTGLRITDVLKLRLSDVRDGQLVFDASKTGKGGSFQVDGSLLGALIERRKASKAPHLFLLACGSKPVTERMLTDAWARARAKALPECPEVAGLLLRHMRKRAAQLAGSLAEAQALLQHGSAATTQRHYRGREKLRPVR